MAPLVLGTNILALRAGRELNRATDRASTAFERLSSGLRINHASDDAAGLAVVSRLQSDERIYKQGVRNLNDGISLLTVADSSLSQMQQILGRMQELAQQGANGTVTNTQRAALNQEVTALTEEYNRIRTATQFNGRSLLTSTDSLSLQAGYSRIDFNIASQSQSTTGNGTFTLASTTSSPFPQNLVRVAADVNGDGKLDLIQQENFNGEIFVHLGNGDGTLGAAISSGLTGVTSSMAVGDFTGDGIKDIVYVSGVALVTLRGNGNGTFGSATTYAASYTFYVATPSLVDLDGDSDLDIVAGFEGAGGYQLQGWLNNGSGSFTPNVSIAAGGYPTITTGDFNGDRIPDAVIAAYSAGNTGIALGNGNGTFAAPINTGGLPGNTNGQVSVGDFNNDGFLDVVRHVESAPGSGIAIFFGNGTGSLSAPISTLVSPFAGGGSGTPLVLDADGDGFLDVIDDSQSTGNSTLLLGNGNGTFRIGATFSGIRGTLGDFNGDGVTDLVTSAAGYVDNVYLANTQTTTTGVAVAALSGVDVSTQSGAQSSLTTLSQYQATLETVRANVGASLSRVEFSVAYLRTQAAGVGDAASRIQDLDVADEVAKLVSTRIVAEAASAILAQANQLPALVLRLLK